MRQIAADKIAAEAAAQVEIKHARIERFMDSMDSLRTSMQDTLGQDKSKEVSKEELLKIPHREPAQSVEPAATVGNTSIVTIDGAPTEVSLTDTRHWWYEYK